jgi:4-hydroxy-tetrahydrodipicolinate synthase
MTRVRELCGEDFELLVGDDHMLYDALVDPAIRADGSCSFTANIVPSAMSALVMAGREGRVAPARQLHEKLELLFRLVSVTAEEAVEVNDQTLAVPQRSRNPLPIKTALGLLGIIDDVCRAPLMGMGPKGIAQVRSALRLTARRASDVLADVAHAFDVDLEQLAGGPLSPKISRIVHRVGA